MFDFGEVPYAQGDIVVIPPMVPHSNNSMQGFRNIHINMTSPMLTFKSPTVIADDSNHFILDAFVAAFYHFYSSRTERTELLSSYGNLICCYLSAYQTVRQRPGVVEEIVHSIISNYSDCDYELDAYLHSLPFRRE